MYSSIKQNLKKWREPMGLTLRISLLLILSVIRYPSFSQHYTLERALKTPIALNHTHSFLQDSSGFIWIASDHKLVRFDGRTWQVYDESIYGEINGIVLRKNGELFFAAGHSVYKLPQGNAIELGLPKPTLWIQVPQKISNIFMDTSGLLWIKIPEKILCIDSAKNISSWEFPEKESILFTEDSDGLVWISTNKGEVAFIDPQKNELTNVAHPAAMKKVTFMSVNPEAITLWGDSLTILARDKNDPKVISGVERKFSEFTPVGNSDSGILLLHKKEQTLFRAAYDASRRLEVEPIFSTLRQQIKQVQIPRTQAVFQNRFGELLGVYPEGIFRLQPNFFQVLRELPFYTVTGRAVDRPNERVIIAISGNLYTYPVKSPADVSPYLPESASILANVASMAMAGDALWLGTLSGKVVKVVRDRVIDVWDYSDIGGSVFYINKDKYEDVWICQAPSDTTLVGITRMTPRGEVSYYGPDHGIENRIISVTLADDTLFATGIGSSSYLYYFDHAADTFVNISKKLPFEVFEGLFEVHQMAKGNDGNYWLATTHGVLVLDPEKDTAVQVELELVPSQMEIKSIVQQPDGPIWLSPYYEGLMRIDGKHISLFDERNGLPHSNLGHRMITIEGNKMRVGTIGGEAFCSNLDNIYPTPRPVITEIKINGEYHLNDSIFKSKKGILEVTSGETIEISMSLPPYKLQSVFFEYRIRGLSEEWKMTTPSGTNTIVRIPEGNFDFQVRALLRGGFVWSDPVSFRIRSASPVIWYIHPVALMSYMVVVVLLIIYVFWYRKHAKRKLRNAQAQLIHSEKMASLGLLTAGVAHEINNPLNFIFNGITVLKKDIKRLTTLSNTSKDRSGLINEINELISTIRNGADRMNRIVKALQFFGRVNEQKSVFDIRENLLITMKLLKMKLENIHVTFDFNHQDPVMAYPGKMNQVFVNLIDNASSAILSVKESGNIRIATCSKNGHIIITIEDDGPGIPPEKIKKVMDLFYTTKPPGEGTGIGLSISYNILLEHNGTLSIENRKTGGCRVKLQWPVSIN